MGNCSLKQATNSNNLSITVSQRMADREPTMCSSLYPITLANYPCNLVSLVFQGLQMHKSDSVFLAGFT